MALRWPKVDLAGRRFTVDRSVWQDRNVGKVERQPKGKRARTVAMSALTAGRLSAHLEAQVIDGGAPADGLVWPGRDGGPMAKDTPTRIVRRALERAGLVDDAGRRWSPSTACGTRAPAWPYGRRGPHRGIRQLGHSRVSTTAAVYAHVVDEDRQLDAVAASRDRMLNPEWREEWRGTAPTPGFRTTQGIAGRA